MGKWARRSFSLSLWLTGVSTVMSMAGNRWEIFVPQHILFSWTAIVYVWKQLEDTDSLLCCPHCNLVKYCSAECLEEHWVKVHNKHCSSLASSVVPSYQHKEGECSQCLAVAAKGGSDAVADPLNPVYPCVLKSLDGTCKSLISHHPFPLNGDPEDRIERLVVLINRGGTNLKVNIPGHF